MEAETKMLVQESLGQDGDIKRRIERALPCDIAHIDWSKLDAAISAEALKFCGHKVEHLEQPSWLNKSPDSFVEISSGGTIFFCIFRSDGKIDSSVTGGSARESCAVMKFISDRLHCQSEQFAAELAFYLSIPVPSSRIILFSEEETSEWNNALQNARNRKMCKHLAQEMSRPGCLLLLEFVPGLPLVNSSKAFAEENIEETSFLVGKILGLDMMLGNPDRLFCERLSWPGNSANLIFATGGKHCGKIVAIDAVVQRKPPHGLKSSEDIACEELSELAINFIEVVEEVLLAALSGKCALPLDGQVLSQKAIVACQNGLKDALGEAVKLQGIFEMLHQQIDDWINEFIDDIEGCYDINYDIPVSSPREGSACQSQSAVSQRIVQSPHTAYNHNKMTFSSSFTANKIRAMHKEANRDEDLKRRLDTWNCLFAEKCTDLKRVLEEWQANSSCQHQGEIMQKMKLTTGFLNGVRPIVDLYELKVRLQHLLSRLKILSQACFSSGSPTSVTRGIFISGAVAANSFHVLKHLGITHLLNCTQDLFPEGDSRSIFMKENFQKVCRIPLQDLEDEDIKQYFQPAIEFIDDALACNGKVLVHCHAGQSRSCSIVLAWLMQREKLTLRQALMKMHEERPNAAPNAGYMKALGLLEEEIHGTKSELKVKKARPLLRLCPECLEKVGLSQESVSIHLRLKHPQIHLATRLENAS